MSSHDILQLRGTSTASPRVALHSVKDSIWFSTIATKPLIVSPREPRDRRKPRPRSAKHRILRDHLSSKWYTRRLKAYEYLPAFQGAGFHMFKPSAFASFAALAALKRVFILLRAQLVHCPLCYLLIVVSFTPAVDRPEVPVSIVVIGTPKGWNVSRRYFTPTFYFCDVHVSAVLWVQLLLRDTLLSAVPRCL